MNVFQLNYDTRLQSWYDLRKTIRNSDTREKCVEIDNWWQRAPLVNHHLHILDSQTWPDPWELLVENTYCTVARAVGICYTLLLTGVESIRLVEATDKTGNDVVLVLAEDAKYVLNYWPESVLSSNLSEFTIKREIDITPLQSKI